jgi:glutamine synthetase
MFKDSSEVLKFIKDEDVKFLDIRFTDLPGVQQHFNIPASTVDEDFFSVGQLFDGSSIRGFANIHESDMQLIPDVTTAYVDPFRVEKTLIMLFDIYNPRNGEIYHRDPRQVAKKAEKYLASTGIADTAFFAPEAEFYIFDDVRYEVKQNGSFYSVDSEEGAWNSGRIEEGGNLANKTPYKGGYFPVSPVDKRPSRGRHGRPGGDQLSLRHHGSRGGRHPEVQVHRQEHGAGMGQGRYLHAEAAVW